MAIEINQIFKIIVKKWGGVAFVGSLGAQKYAGISVSKSSTRRLRHSHEVSKIKKVFCLKHSG